MSKTSRPASEIASSLRKTAQEYHDSNIGYDTLTERNRADWDDAERDPAVKAAVLAILRGS